MTQNIIFMNYAKFRQKIPLRSFILWKKRDFAHLGVMLGDGPIDALNIWIENHASKYKVTDNLPS